jgi:hypothetical protein
MNKGISYQVSDFVLYDYYNGDEQELENALTCTLKIFLNDECWFDTSGFNILEFVADYKKWKSNSDRDFLYCAIDYGFDPLILFSSFNGTLKCYSPWQLFETSDSIDRNDFILQTEELVRCVRKYIFLDLKLDIDSYLYNGERIYF